MTNYATNVDARRDAIKRVMGSAGSTIFSVTFVKKDGSLRVLTVQQAALAPRCKGDSASASAKQGVATRKSNYPNLFPVYDIHSDSIKSINLDTVKAITLRGYMSVWSTPHAA